jgi:ribosomal subunit interface protein
MNMEYNLRDRRTSARELKGSRQPIGPFDVVIRASGLELTPLLRKAATEKIGRVRQYAPRALRARVHLQRELMKSGPGQFRVTVHYEIPGNDLVAVHRAEFLFTALDLVAEKIERRLRRRKTARLASRLGRRARACRIADFCGVQEVEPWERI